MLAAQTFGRTSSTRDSVPSVVESIRKQFWAEKVDVPKNEANKRGAIDGVWFAEDEADVKGTSKNKTVVVLFMHGGAYHVGDAAQFWRVYIDLIKRSNPLLANNGHRLALFSLEYSLAPQYTYPTALNEATDAYKWLTEELEFKHIIVAGDSAGGNLAAALLHSDYLSKPSPHTQAPLAALLFSPWLDLANKSASEEKLEQISQRSDFLPGRHMPKTAQNFAGNVVTDLSDPRVTFTHGDVLVPKGGMWVAWSDGEVLGPACRVFVKAVKERLAKGGAAQQEGQITTHVKEDLPHDWVVMFWGVFNMRTSYAGRKASETIDDAVKFIEQAVGLLGR
ncbi:hypothetical protein HDV00_012689 [Rhizophlyctis rosea]|nr:hypothetical protein HDV00_012689 [Rhizophlyctis rosea]